MNDELFDQIAALLTRFRRMGHTRNGVRDTWAYDGQDSDQHVVFGIMVHGEEWGSLPGALALMNDLTTGARTFPGKITVFIGNADAALAGRRFLDADLNRVFLDLPPDAPAHGTLEHDRATALRPILDTADLFVDFHQTIEATASPFVISPWTPGIETWVRRLQPAPAWVTRAPDASFSTGTCCADEYVRNRGGMAFTIELSQRGFSASAAAATTRVMADALDAVAAGPIPGAPGPLPTCYRTAHTEPFSHSGLALKVGLANFQPVQRGDNLAAPGRPDLWVPDDGLLLFPKYPHRDAAGLVDGPLPGEIYRLLLPLDRPPSETYGGRP